MTDASSAANVGLRGDVVKKVLMVGESNAGKTSLVKRYTQGAFQPACKPTVGVDFALKVVQFRDAQVKLQLWDIAGQEHGGRMSRVYFHSAVGAMVVCDVTRKGGLQGALEWKKEIDSKVFLGASAKTIPCVLLLNKCDLGKPQSTREEMNAFCEEHGFVAWFETSAKDGRNINISFARLVEEVMKDPLAPVPEGDAQNSKSIKSLRRSSKTPKRCAC